MAERRTVTRCRLAAGLAMALILGCGRVEELSYSLPSGFTGPVAIFRTDTVGATTGMIPSDGILIERGRPLRHAKLNVTWASKTTRVALVDQQAFSGSSGSCHYEGFTFYVGTASPLARQRAIQSTVALGRARLCSSP
jgi:hypothetical protein